MLTGNWEKNIVAEALLLVLLAEAETDKTPTPDIWQLLKAEKLGHFPETFKLFLYLPTVILNFANAAVSDPFLKSGKKYWDTAEKKLTFTTCVNHGRSRFSNDCYFATIGMSTLRNKICC